MTLKARCFQQFNEMIDWEMKELISQEQILVEYNDGFEMSSRLEAFNKKVRRELFHIVFNERLLAFLSVQIELILEPNRREEEKRHIFFGQDLDQIEFSIEENCMNTSPNATNTKFKDNFADDFETSPNKFSLANIFTSQQELETFKKTTSPQTKKLKRKTKKSEIEKQNNFSLAKVVKMQQKTKYQHTKMIERRKRNTQKEKEMEQKKQQLQLVNRLKRLSMINMSQAKLAQLQKFHKDIQVKGSKSKKARARYSIIANSGTIGKKVLAIGKLMDIAKENKNKKERNPKKIDVYKTKEFTLIGLLNFKRTREVLRDHPLKFVLNQASKYKKNKVLNEIKKFWDFNIRVINKRKKKRIESGRSRALSKKGSRKGSRKGEGSVILRKDSIFVPSVMGSLEGESPLALSRKFSRKSSESGTPRSPFFRSKTKKNLNEVDKAGVKKQMTLKPSLYKNKMLDIQNDSPLTLRKKKSVFFNTKNNSSSPSQKQTLSRYASLKRRKSQVINLKASNFSLKKKKSSSHKRVRKDKRKFLYLDEMPQTPVNRKGKKRRRSNVSIYIKEINETEKGMPSLHRLLTSKFRFNFNSEDAKLIILAFFDAHRRNRILENYYKDD